MTLGPRKYFPLCITVFASILFLLAAAPVRATIRYHISLADLEKHQFRVGMRIPKTAAGVTIALPAWNALYQVRDFSYRVRDVIASESGSVRKYWWPEALDKQTWRVLPPDPQAEGSVGINYTIEWNDPGPFNSQLDAHHAFLNFAETLMYVPDWRDEDVEVVFDNIPAGWKIIVELPAGKEANSFTAPSYDKLVDAPVEIGKFDEFEFDSAGAHFRVVVDAKEWNRGHLEDGLKRITASEIQMMGAPFRQYTFFFRIGPFTEVGGGGMEHSNCTAISAGSVDAAIYTSAHEMFHAWNVKRIRPQALEPVDFTKEQYTRALWFAEGVTSTYGSYTLERTGIWTKEQWYGDLAGQISELETHPARKWQSVEESSLDTWYDKYPEYGLPDRSISYYNKGQIIGVMLDLAIRDATDNHKSLDDALRGLYSEYAQRGKFYNESDGIRGVVEEVAGKDFADFFRSYVAGTVDIPYNTFLSAAGLELKPDSQAAATLGFRPMRAPGSGVSVGSVEPGSNSERAGLRPGDVLLTVNGASVGNMRRFVAEHSAGETIHLHVRRGEQELDLSFALGASSDVRYTLVEAPNATDRQLRIRNGMLHGTTD